MNLISNRIIISLFCLAFLNIFNLKAQSENQKIDKIIEQKKTFNKTTKNSVVYKIQLYNGNESEAYKIKSNFHSLFPEYKTIVLYKSPEWKTQVVYFKTRLEADRALLKIKEHFFGAIVLKDNV